MPITAYKSIADRFEEDSQELPGEMTFRDYFAQFCAAGIMPGYHPNVALVINADSGNHNTKERTAFIQKAEQEIVAYFNGGRMNGSKARYKPYNGGPYHVSTTANGIFICFLNEVTAQSFVKSMRGHFEMMYGASEQNARITGMRQSADMKYEPESKPMRAFFGYAVDDKIPVARAKPVVEQFVAMTDSEARVMADKYLAAFKPRATPDDMAGQYTAPATHILEPAMP